jgi:hypothetical protein
VVTAQQNGFAPCQMVISAGAWSYSWKLYGDEQKEDFWVRRGCCWQRIRVEGRRGGIEWEDSGGEEHAQARDGSGTC